MKFAQLITRLFAIVYICGLIVLCNISPAIAAQDNNNNKIIDQLPMPNIQKKAQEITKVSPYETNLEYTTESPVNQGLNEIQGTADFDKMKRSNEKTLPVVLGVEKALDNVKNDTENNVGSVLDKAGDTANYVKDKAGDVVNSVTDKAEDTVRSIKNKVKF